VKINILMKILLKYLLLNLYSELFFINIYYSFPVIKTKIKIKNIFYIFIQYFSIVPSGNYSPVPVCNFAP